MANKPRNPPQDPHPCPACDKVFTRKADLERHHRNHHEDQEPKTCKMPNCIYEYKQDGQLKIHMRTKHPTPTPQTMGQSSSTSRAATSTTKRGRRGRGGRNSTLRGGQGVRPAEASTSSSSHGIEATDDEQNFGFPAFQHLDPTSISPVPVEGTTTFFTPPFAQSHSEPSLEPSPSITVEGYPSQGLLFPSASDSALFTQPEQGPSLLRPAATIVTNMEYAAGRAGPSPSASPSFDSPLHQLYRTPGSSWSSPHTSSSVSTPSTVASEGFSHHSGSAYASPLTTGSLGTPITPFLADLAIYNTPSPAASQTHPEYSQASISSSQHLEQAARTQTRNRSYAAALQRSASAAPSLRPRPYPAPSYASVAAMGTTNRSNNAPPTQHRVGHLPPNVGLPPTQGVPPSVLFQTLSEFGTYPDSFSSMNPSTSGHSRSSASSASTLIHPSTRIPQGTFAPLMHGPSMQQAAGPSWQAAEASSSHSSFIPARPQMPGHANRASSSRHPVDPTPVGAIRMPSSRRPAASAALAPPANNPATLWDAQIVSGGMPMSDLNMPLGWRSLNTATGNTMRSAVPEHVADSVNSALLSPLIIDNGQLDVAAGITADHPSNNTGDGSFDYDTFPTGDGLPLPAFDTLATQLNDFDQLSYSESFLPPQNYTTNDPGPSTFPSMNWHDYHHFR